MVRALQLVFVEDWAYATGSRDFIADIARTLPPPRPGPIAAQVLVSGPDSSWEAIHRLHVGAIHAARQRVWLVTPYFVPGEAAMMALTSAALGGLDVRLLVPQLSDSQAGHAAPRARTSTNCSRPGCKVYEYGPRLLHTKALLVDDDLAIIGSANFDHRSFRLNFEVSMLFRDAGVAAELAQLIEGEFAHAPRVRDDRARPLWRVAPARGAGAAGVAAAVSAGRAARLDRRSAAAAIAACDGRARLRRRFPRSLGHACPGCSCCSRSAALAVAFKTASVALAGAVPAGRARPAGGLGAGPAGAARSAAAAATSR